MSELNKYLIEAISCINFEKRSISGKNINKFNISMQLIMSCLEMDNILDELKISKKYFENNIRKIIFDLNDNSNNPEIKFKEQLNEMKKKLGRKDNNIFSVGFPLNIKFAYDKTPSSYNILDNKIENISYNEWYESFANPAKENSDELDMYLRRTPNKLLDKNNFTFWKYQFEANDRLYAIQNLEILLDLLLGKINFTLNFNRRKTSSFVVPNNRISNIRNPFIYIILKDEKYSTHYYDKDISFRQLERITGIRENMYEYFSELPHLNKNDKIDREIIKAFRTYQSGISNHSINEAFLDFWRGLEILTLKNDDESSSTVIDRINSIYNHSYPSLSNAMSYSLIKKRNNIVHKGIDCEITENDRQNTKTMFEILIYFFIKYREEFDFNDFLFVLIHGTNNISGLQEMKENRERGIELIEKIIGWKNNES